MKKSLQKIAVIVLLITSMMLPCAFAGGEDIPYMYKLTSEQSDIHLTVVQTDALGTE